MHNQNRTEYKARLADPAVSAKLAAKAGQWNVLTKELAKRRAATAAVSAADHPPSPGATLQLIEKLLTVNPDPSHLWNHRRELLLLPAEEKSPATQDTPGSTDTSTSTDDKGTATNFVLEEELRLTATCLQRNPKAYSAWFHRKWTVRHWLLQSASASTTNTSTTREEQRSIMLQTELGLCASFLDKDERNFHCWNYRRFVVAALLEVPVLATSSGADDDEVTVKLDGSWKVGGAVMGPQLAIILAPSNANTFSEQIPQPSALTDDVIRSEFEYTTQRIKKNFSNCSAFHYRSKLIDLVLDADMRDEGISRNEEGVAYQARLDMARGELETIQSAVFTEPDDQTAWWYHRFVVAWARPAPAAVWNDEDAAFEAVEMFAELLEEEKAVIQELIDAEGGQCKWGLLALHMLLFEMNKLDGFGTDDDRAANAEEANGCLDQLALLDPDRATRYRSMKR